MRVGVEGIKLDRIEKDRSGREKVRDGKEPEKTELDGTNLGEADSDRTDINWDKPDGGAELRERNRTGQGGTKGRDRTRIKHRSRPR